MSFADSSEHTAETPSKTSDSSHQEKLFDHVMTFGTFDIFHPGHRHYLSEAEKLGKKLTIVIARDHRVESGKGQSPVHDEGTRLKNVQASFPQATVILGDPVDIFAPIRTLHPDILAFGYDQRVPEKRIQELFPTLTIIRIDGYETDKWKSSILREKFPINHIQ